MAPFIHSSVHYRRKRPQDRSAVELAAARAVLVEGDISKLPACRLDVGPDSTIRSEKAYGVALAGKPQEHILRSAGCG